MRPSYVHGASETPLLGQSIGENLDRAVERWGDREALVSCHQSLRYTYAELGEAVDRLARALLAGGLEPGDRLGHLEPELRRVGARAVRDGEGRDRAREHQPGVSHVRARVRAAPVRLPLADRRAGLQDLGLRGDDRVGPRRPARPRARRAARHGRLGGAGGRHRGVRRAPGLPVRRPDQHPVHERDDRLPQGRHAQPREHPQQRLLRGGGLPLHGGRPRLHPRALLPLLRHGHGQPRLHHARRLHGDPGGGLRPRGDAARRPGGALHLALRRADDVHRRARAPGLRLASTSPACAPGSWPARRARSRRCAASWTRCTWRRSRSVTA